MNESTRCPKCGIQLSADAPSGLCPKCLVQAGFESQPLPQPGPEPTVPSPASSGFQPPSVEELAGKFPQLEILELLGKGGMGAVYKARQRGLDRLVAVKILPPEIGHDPAFAERFTREARSLAKLTHSNIVTVYDFGVVGQAFQPDPLVPTSQAGKPDVQVGLYFIVMEYVDGVNLRQAIQAGDMTPKDALAIVPQICEALQFAHDEGIVHRDIKPENILIDKRGRVKIADFGLAKLLGTDASDHSLTATHQVMGTLRYMAPEQMQGSREVDHRADIYSLGVIFYELLTGELPMGKFAPPSKKVQVDVRLDEVVLRALEQDPEQRYQHASEVKTDVDAIVQSGAAPKRSQSAGRTENVAIVERAWDATDVLVRLVRSLLFGITIFLISIALLVLGFWAITGIPYHQAVQRKPEIIKVIPFVPGLGSLLASIALAVHLKHICVRNVTMNSTGLTMHSGLQPSRFLKWDEIAGLPAFREHWWGCVRSKSESDRDWIAIDSNQGLRRYFRPENRREFVAAIDRFAPPDATWAEVLRAESAGVKAGAGPISLPVGDTPNFGELAMGGIMLVLGLVLLACSTIPGAGVLQWVGLGIALGGGGCFAAAWQEDQRLPPGFAPNPGMLAMAGVMLLVGIVLLLIVAAYNQFAPPSPLAWTAIGIILGSGGCFVAAWHDENEDEDDTDKTEVPEQPYQHAREMKPLPHSPSDGHGDVAQRLVVARFLVQGPAIGMVAIGAAAWAQSIAIALCLMFLPREYWTWGMLSASPVVAILGIPFGAVLLLAGLQMKRLQAYTFAVLAGVLVYCVPLGVVWILAMPVAIWAHIVLWKQEVIDAFALHLRERILPLRAGTNQRQTEEVQDAEILTSTVSLPRSKLVPVLAMFNLVGAVLLMLVCAMKPAAFAESVPRIWQVWEQVDAVLGFTMAAGMFAASIGLFLWKPWARKLTMGVCVFGLASFVFDAPYLARFALPDAYAEIQQTVIAEGVEPDLQDFVTLITFVVIFGGMLVVGMTCLIGQLVYFTRPRVVAAFESQGEQSGKLLDWLFTGVGAVAGVVSGLWSVFGGLVLLIGLAAFFKWSSGEQAVDPPAHHVDSKTGEVWSGNPGAEHVIYLGPGSPAVSYRLARHLGLDAPQRAALDQALGQYALDFRALEDQHTQATTDENGHQITTIAPLGPQLPPLMERFWLALESALDGRQLTVGRKTVGLQLGMFETGDYVYRVEIWRVGQINPWYHWTESYPGRANVSQDVGSSGPELPEKLRRFWKEPKADDAAKVE